MATFKSLYRHVGFAACLLTGVLALSDPAVAEEGSGQPSALALRGFATLGIARSSNDQAEVLRDLTQPRGISDHWTGRSDSVLGLQANFKATEALEAVTQIVSRYHYQGNFRPELSWAFLKYEPNPYLSFRAGRIGTEFFMGADSRLIGYSYLAVRPAPDFFVSLPFSYFDGIDTQATTPLGDGILRSKVYTGFAAETIPLPGSGNFFNLHGSPLVGGYLEYQQSVWTWRASYMRVRFSHELSEFLNQLRNSLSEASVQTGIASAQTAADELSMVGRVSNFYSLGVIYDKGPLQVHAMFNRIRHDSVQFENSRSGMLLVGYRIGEVTPFAGYSSIKSKAKYLDTGLPNVGSGEMINYVVGQLLPNTRADRSTTTLGLRWDFSRNKAFKLQADVIRGTPESIYPYLRETPLWNGRTNVLSTSLDFIF